MPVGILLAVAIVSEVAAIALLSAYLAARVVPERTRTDWTAA